MGDRDQRRTRAPPRTPACAVVCVQCGVEEGVVVRGAKACPGGPLLYYVSRISATSCRTKGAEMSVGLGPWTYCALEFVHHTPWGRTRVHTHAHVSTSILTSTHELCPFLRPFHVLVPSFPRFHLAVPLPVSLSSSHTPPPTSLSTTFYLPPPSPRSPYFVPSRLRLPPPRPSLPSRPRPLPSPPLRLSRSTPPPPSPPVSPLLPSAPYISPTRLPHSPPPSPPTLSQGTLLAPLQAMQGVPTAH